MLNSSRIHHLFSVGVMLFMAVALQIQVTLFAGENYQGLRLALADLALPLIGLFIGGSLLLKKTSLPAWNKPFGYRWLFLLTGIMAYSLWRYYMLNGELHHWALINKFMGWFVLLAYLGTGAWISMQYPDALLHRFTKPFLLAFTIFSCAISIPIIYGGYDVDFLVKWQNVINFFQLEGLMGNRNAFAFLLACITMFISILSAKHPDIVSRKMLAIFWLLCPGFFVLNGSRVLWLATPILLLFVRSLGRKNFRRVILPCVLIGFTAILVIYPSSLRTHTLARVASILNIYNYFAAPHPGLDQKMHESGEDVRLKLLDVGYKTWQEHPLLGSGLGAIMKNQQEQLGEVISVLDNSALWLLVETGVPGLLTFIGCFIAMLIALYKILKDKNIPEERRSFVLFAMAMLLTFGFFSLFHEILYTRFFWFFLGLALARTRLNGSTA